MKMRYLNRTFFVVLMIASQMFSSACAAPPPAQQQERSLLAAARKAAENSTDIRAFEQKALATTGADAERQGNRLILHLKSGTEKIYENRPECEIQDKESKCQMFALAAHANSQSTFVVAKLYYESSEYLLVDDVTGDETVLRGFPDFSPSGRHVLVLLMNDEQIGFAVQIWRRNGHKFILDWSGSPYTEGSYTSYELVRWLNENIIVLHATTDFDPPKPSVKMHFELRQVADGWKVVEVR